jgi:hypothetical protein
MGTNKSKNNLGEMLSLAGIRMDGNNPWDI